MERRKVHHNAPKNAGTEPTCGAGKQQHEGSTPDDAEQGVGAPTCSSAEEIKDFLKTGIMIAIPKSRRL